MRIQAVTYLFALILCTLPGLHAQSAPHAVKGVIDLREYNFQANGPLELKGEFEFYWNQIINPAVQDEAGEMIYINVPGSWHRMKKEHPEISRFGFATYRLMILLPAQINEIAFSISDVHSASGYFLNGKAIDYLGFPGVNKYQTVIRDSRPVVVGTVNSQEVELLIRVSNFDHRLSGIVGGITIGTSTQIRERRDRDIYRAHFLIGAFLIIGIYFLGLFLIRSDLYRLYFSLICILMALRVSLVTSIPELEVLSLNGLVLSRIDYLNIYFFAPFFILMIRSLFPIEFPLMIFRISMWISALFIVIVIVSPISLFTFTFLAFFVFFLLISLTFLYVILMAWIRGRSHAPAFTLGLVILFMGILNDMLNEVEVINTHYMVHYTKNHLEDLVEERTTELQSMSDELEKQKKKLESSNRGLLEAMNSRNRLFAIIGHDVRGPIGYNMQALEMLIDKPRMKVVERLELLKMMASSSAITYNLLENLLVWGRSQTGKLKATPVRVNLKELVDESLELINFGLKEKGLKVEVYVSVDHYLKVDREQFFIVIRNLVNNAMKFTPKKGSIYISSKILDREVIFSIRDTGIGIPKAIISRLLDGRSHLSTNGTRGEKGAGLGLKICHEIVESNKGWMKIDSDSGKGTTIIIGMKASKPKPA